MSIEHRGQAQTETARQPEPSRSAFASVLYLADLHHGSREAPTSARSVEYAHAITGCPRNPGLLLDTELGVLASLAVA